MDTSSFLIIERGSPFEEGTIISLNNPIITLGRKGSQWKPDISFDNAFVSRKHAALFFQNGHFYIKDLNSKHGSFLNNKPLLPNKKTILKNKDKITFANGLIALSYSTHRLDETFDITPLLTNKEESQVKLDPLKQELVILETTYAFSEKEYKFIECLVRKKGQFVTKEELKAYVWSERSYSSDITPDVSSEELNALVYRIRRKTGQDIYIESIRGKGYILSFI